MGPITYDEFLRRVPKVELHCHFEGTVRAATFADLARKHDVALPSADADRLYDYDSIYEFLTIFGIVSSTLIDREDFARAAFESIEDGVRLGNLVYREMFFNPTLHTSRGIPYPVVVDGLIDGITEAERRFGVRCRLIADVYRQDSPQHAAEMVREVLEHRRDEVIGLGMDGAEAPDPPERFVEAYRLAGAGGLRLTAHAPGPRLPRARGRRGRPARPRRGHRDDDLPDRDRRLLLRRGPDGPSDHRDGARRPSGHAQLRRSDDVPYRHR